MGVNIKILLLVAAVMMFYSPAISQENYSFEYSGYVNLLGSYLRMPDTYNSSGSQDRDFFANINRLRIRPVFNLWEDARIEAHYELDLLASKNGNPFMGVTGSSNRQAVNLRGSTELTSNIFLYQFIDRLYFKNTFDFGEIVIGRQMISWGTGRVWQPMDLFNPVNPANFAQLEKPGADAISAKYIFGDFTDLEVVYNVADKFRKSNYAARFRSNYRELDLSGMVGYFDDRIVLGAAFAGNLFTAGFRGEGIYSQDEASNKGYFRAIAGLDYQFSSELYALIEYLYNGEGKLCKCSYGDDIQRLFSGEILNLSQHYLNIRSTYQLHPLLMLAADYMQNLPDLSGYASLTAAYNVLENMNLTFGGIYFYGSRLSEYSYFPSAVYFTAEYNF